MQWNTDIFLALNASSYPGAARLLAAELLASSPVLLAPALLTCLWVWARHDRRPALLAVAAGLFIGQGLNVLLGAAWYENRPFMAGVGHTWMAHVADNGFPSDHATLAWSLGLGLVFTGASRGWGIVACLFGLAAGWARIYLGVHFPIDVAASVPVGLMAAAAALLAMPAMRIWLCPPAERFYKAALNRLPARLRWFTRASL